MRNKKLVAAVAVTALAVAGAFIATHVPSDAEPVDANGKSGVVNPDNAATGMSQEAAPQLSTERFELPPSVGTGSYTEPEHRKEKSEPKDQTKR